MSLTLAPRVPAEFVGRARVLRDAIVAEDEPTGRLVTALMAPLPDRIKRRCNPIPRAATLKAVAHAWRHDMPPKSRLALDVRLERKSLRIHEMRLSSSVYKSAAWTDDDYESGLVILGITLEAWAFHYTFTTCTIAHVSQHAIARRLQRSPDGSEGAIVRDLQALGQAHHALADREGGTEFTVPAGGGVWAGSVKLMRDRAARAPSKSLLTRTFLDG